MTTIDKLSLMGIRSYGVDDDTTIKFYKPLTILLGRNGSGKSTIIEAVRMATTGLLPPFLEKNGSAFIHDPRLNNETETKAKIRLLFTNVRGDQYIVSRHFRLTLKRLPRNVPGYKPEYRALEQTLKQYDANKGGSARSYRASDLNDLLPVVMRVSKPVLNNVIFVHQEDSLWPLSDPNTVKKRFDDIFAATRYSKALEVIRKYRNDQSKDLNTVNARLLHFEDKVKVLEAVRSEVDRIQVKRDELNRGVVLLENEIAGLKQEASTAGELARKYAKLTLEMVKSRVQVEGCQKQKREKLSELAVRLTDIDDEEIRKQLEELQIKLDNGASEYRRKKMIFDQLTEDVDMKRSEQKKRERRKGMLEQQARAQRDRLEKLEGLKNDVLSSRDLKEQLLDSGDPLQLPSLEDDVERWSCALDELLRDAEAHVKKLTEDGNNTLDAVSASRTDVKIRLEAAKNEHERKLSSVSEHREKLTKIRSELRDLEHSQISVKDAEGRVKALENVLNEKQQNGLIENLAAKIEEQKERISSTKRDLYDARRTRDLLQRDRDERAKLDAARRAVKTSRIQVSSIMEELLETQISAVRDIAELDQDSGALDTLRGQITSVGAISDDNVTEKHSILDDISAKILDRSKALVEKLAREHAKSVESFRDAEAQKVEAEKTWRDVGSEVLDTKSNIHRVIKRLQNLRDPPEELKILLESASLTINSPIDSRLFGNEWFIDAKKGQDTLKTAISKARQKVSQQQTGLMLAVGDLEQFEEHPKHMCPACGMVSSKKVDAMRSNLQSRIEIYRDPARLDLAKRCLEALEKSLEDIKRLDALTETARELNPKLTKASADKVEMTQKFDHAKKTHELAVKALSDAKGLSGNANTGEVFEKKLQLNHLMQNLRRDQQELSLLQDTLSVSREDERSLVDVDSQVRKFEKDLTNMEESLERDKKSLDTEKDDFRRVEVRYHQAKQLCSEQAANSERHKGLVIEKEGLSSSLRRLEKEIEVERNSCSTLQAELQEADEEFQRTRGENATLLAHANSKLSKRRAKTQAWTECKREMDAYLRSGNDKELETLRQSLDAIDAEVSSKTIELREKNRELQTASDSRKDVEKDCRNLRDNQKYRLLEQDLQATTRNMGHIQDKLDALEREAGEIPADKEERLTVQVNKKNSDLHATIGIRHGYTERYKEKQKELAEVESEGSRRMFDEFRIKKQTMQLASGDLDRYHRALDQALMAFHTLKMNSINRTIKELWQKTYRGRDIEEIEIVSDHGDNKGGAVRRNFNYRVQMRQGGAALDMRGRCSAGQKVLACLVIRLALAESFCSDCGILALDEPTTNLDRDNIRSLAEALRSLIELRRNQRNFQLVLITHDQEFIESLGARQFCDDFYYIYKDDTGVSRAKMQSLQTIL